MTNADPHAPRTVVPIEPALLIAEAFDQAQVTEIRHSVTSCAHASGSAANGWTTSCSRSTS